MIQFATRIGKTYLLDVNIDPPSTWSYYLWAWGSDPNHGKGGDVEPQQSHLLIPFVCDRYTSDMQSTQVHLKPRHHWGYLHSVELTAVD